jgi:hypothetical protein
VAPMQPLHPHVAAGDAGHPSVAVVQGPPAILMTPVEFQAAITAPLPQTVLRSTPAG